eukprot:2779815-Rhodomonas_salina.2
MVFWVPVDASPCKTGPPTTLMGLAHSPALSSMTNWSEVTKWAASEPGTIRALTSPWESLAMHSTMDSQIDAENWNLAAMADHKSVARQVLGNANVKIRPCGGL